MAAETFRANPDFSTEEVITQLGVGEALVSVLEDKGIPSMVGRTMMRPPSSRLGPITPEERRAMNAASPVAGLYDAAVDRHSAYEELAQRTARKTEDADEPEQRKPRTAPRHARRHRRRR